MLLRPATAALPFPPAWESACAKRLKNEPGKVIAVIGDGSMTAGIAYEGLNQAGDIHNDLIVILNDNEMSIAHNVGALSSFLSRKFSAKMLQDLRKEFGDFLEIPAHDRR